MHDDLDLDLSELEVQEQENPSSEGDLALEQRNFERSLKIVQDAMENVIQEILLTLEDGSAHMVYITKLDISPSGQVDLEFSTLEQDRKAELAPHVEQCVKIQIQQAMKEYKPKKRFNIF